MEFYVKPEFRRKGYGTAMFKRIQMLFADHGVKRMYLTADPITGKPFWESLGFVNTSERSPENGQEIYEKRLVDKSVTVKIIKYPDDLILHSIAKKHGEIADKVIRGLTNVISTAHRHSDFFCTILYYDFDEIIGYANFIQSSAETSKWFYTDLWVDTEYRRRGYATEMINTGLRHLSELNAKTLLCSVSPNNEASLCLQKALGFEQVETEPFENFEVDGLRMFKISIPMNFNIVPLTDDFNYVMFICELLTHPSNALTLHLKAIPQNECRQFFKQIRQSLIFDAPDDELNYIIRKGIVPIAWLKLNGLSKDSLWISMLVAHEKFRNLGVGTFALNFTEKFALATKRKHIYISTTEDNIVAQSLYEKAGYVITKEECQQYEDKTEWIRYTFHKEIPFSS